MKTIRAFMFTAAAVAAFSPVATAAETVLWTPDIPVKEAIKSGLLSPATGQLKTMDSGYTDFDALSTVNDPLYRAGSKELLKQLMKSGAVASPRGTPVFRDALNSRPVSAIKKPRVKKSLPSDPVKIKNTL